MDLDCRTGMKTFSTRIWEIVWIIRKFYCSFVRSLLHIGSDPFVQTVFFLTPVRLLVVHRNNPGANKEPDATNFMFLAQIYGGVNVSTGELVSQNMLYNDGSATTGDTTGTDTTSQKKDKNNDTKQPGGRRLGQQYTANTQEEEEEKEQISPIPRGLSYWANLPLNEDDSSSAVISSQVRLLPDMNHQRRRRRVLQANDHFEVHRLEQEIMDDIVVESGDGDLVTLQFYLLAE